MAIKGSCCCGEVQFELKNQPAMMGTCHCSRCRKVGAGNMVFIKKDDLVWKSGKDAISVFEPAEGYKYPRCFCSKCGTALGEILAESETFPISAHALDDEIDVTNSFHEFVSEKPSWSHIGDDAKQFEGHPVQE